MRTLIEILAGLAILANAVIYGTDVFGAIVLRPAIAAVDDRTLTQLLGHIHRIADVRLRNITVVGLITAIARAAVAAASGHWVSAAAGALATLAVITFIAVYNRVSKPVNTALTAAALADQVPRDARQLQARWDSVINARVALQTLALVALCVALVAA
jgi:chemotaxis regulatin CheY-phosphate phosphatase CheZ